jgi:tetratricopeptide (TPR) repeat protein
MNGISLNMIVLNEEKFLPGCLDSIKDLVDEIIIADTGSTDNTIQIAKKFGAIVFSYKWKNDFADARNFVLQKSNYDWILYLDADERIYPEFHSIIKTYIGRSDIDAVLLKLRSLICTDTHEQVQIAPYPRLFRRMEGIKFEGRIHEQITPSLVLAGARFEESNIVIEHLGYSQQDDIIEQKKKRNLQSLLQIVKEEPSNAYALFQLGQNYLIMKENEKGVEYLKRSLELGTLTKTITASALALLAQCYNKIGDFKQAEEFCIKSLEIAPNQLFAKLLLGEIYSNSGEFDSSLKYYNESLEYIKLPEHLRKTGTAIDLSYDPSFIFYKIGIIYMNQKKLTLAEKSFLDSMAINPKFHPSLIELGNINFQLGKYDEAIQYLTKVNLPDLKDISLLMNIAGLFEEMKDFNDCAIVLEYVINIDPQNAKAYFFLGTSHLALNDFEKAKTYFLKSYDLAPEVTETIQNLAFIHTKQHNYGKALEEFLKLEKLLPNDENVKRKIIALKKKLEADSSS